MFCSIDVLNMQQNAKEKICTRVLFVADFPTAWTLSKRSPVQVFPHEFHIRTDFYRTRLGNCLWALKVANSPCFVYSVSDELTVWVILEVWEFYFANFEGTSRSLKVAYFFLFSIHVFVFLSGRKYNHNPIIIQHGNTKSKLKIKKKK